MSGCLSHLWDIQWSMAEFESTEHPTSSLQPEHSPVLSKGTGRQSSTNQDNNLYEEKGKVCGGDRQHWKFSELKFLLAQQWSHLPEQIVLYFF